MTTNTTRSMYPFALLTDSSRADFTTDRLCKISWKQTKDMTKAGKTAHKARCVSVPKIILEVSPVCLKDALTQSMEDLQDTFIRSYLESYLDQGKSPEPLSAADITPEAVSTFYAEQASGGRLSKEKITNWFADNLLSNLEAKFAALEGMTDEKLTKAIADYQAACVKLSSPQANFSPTIATQLKKTISENAEDDQIKKQLLAKLDAFLKPASEIVLLNL